MTPSEKATIRELYYQHPEYSARQISRLMKKPISDVIIYLRTLGYTSNRHEAARQAAKAGKKPQSPIKFEPKKEEKKKAEPVPMFRVSKIEPLVEEQKKQKALIRKANQLLQEAEKAAMAGDIEKYTKLRKEYEIADRAATAYKQRGKCDKNINDFEYQYTICR